MISDYNQTHSRDQQEVIRLNALLDHSAGRIAELEDELTELRAFKAARGGQEAVALMDQPKEHQNA